MRRFFLSASLVLLVCALFFLRSCRFEALSGRHSLSLADLKLTMPIPPEGTSWGGSPDHPILIMRTATDGKPVSFRIPLSGLGEVPALRIRFAASARELARGANKWEEGRILLEWKDSNGSGCAEVDPIEALSGNESLSDLTIVCRPASGHAVPALIFQHLGNSGDFRVETMKLLPVRERGIWRAGRWVLAAGWLVWMALFLKSSSGRSMVRCAMAAALWVLIGANFAFPGPWKTLRAFVIPYQMEADVIHADSHGRNPPDMASLESDLPDPDPAEAGLQGWATRRDEPMGRIPLQGGWLIQIKHHLSKLRLLLHVLLLFGPTLAFIILVGRRSATIIAAGLAIAIEAAQVGFGYGFDAWDICDIACDAAGIALALWVFHKIVESRLKVAIPR